MIATTLNEAVRIRERIPTSEGLSISIDYDWDAIEQLKNCWTSVLEENSSLTIFSSPEWLSSWWKAYGAGKQLISLTLKDDAGNVVGILPLYRELLWSYCDRQWHGLRLVGDGSGDSDNLDFPVRRGYEAAAARAIMSWLSQESNWAVCRFNTLPQCSQSLGPILGALSSRRWPRIVTHTPQWHIPLPETWNAYLEHLTPEFRPLLTRYPNRLASRYRCEVLKCRTEDDLRVYLPVLFDLHQRRWRQAGKPGSFTSSERRAFYHRMASAFLRRNWLEFWILKLNGAPAAAQFCFRHRNSVFLLQEGFDPKHSKDKVGYALRAKMLQHFIDSGIERYDFLGGTQDYKVKFGAVKSSYQNVTFAKPRTLGGVAVGLYGLGERARLLLRSALPSAVRSRMRATLEMVKAPR